MSFSLAQEPGVSSASVAQGSGPMFRLPMEENPPTSIPAATLSQTDSGVAGQRTAPQLVEISLSSIVTRSSLSGQPQSLTILVSPPTSSLASVPATDVTAAVPSNSPSVSTSILLPTITTPTTSVVTLVAATSTTPTSPAESSSAGIALASETPTATTVTEAVVEVPSSSPSQAANDESVVTEGGHHAPFYIAVIVGTILAIGLIAAVIAWAVRLRMHARRRRENPIVPWANHHQAECALEACRDATFIGQPIDRSGSKDISSQDAIPWEPCGDRDVGEPKRSGSYVRSSLRSSLVPGFAPYAEHQPYPVHAHNVTHPYYHGHATRDADTVTSSDGTLDGYSSSSSLGPLQVANRTPGDTSPSLSYTSTPVNMYTAHTGWTGDFVSRPQFLESYHNGNIPTSAIPSRSTEETWGSHPLPDRTQTRNEETITDDSSSWTGSLKSNFTDAFNAVAASLPSGAALMINRQDKDLDGLPSRPTQSSGRRSLFSFFSRSNSSASQPWTLEEHGDGTGRVVFHDIEADGYNYGLTTSESQPLDATPIRRTSTRDGSDSISSPVAQPPRSAMLKSAYNTGPRHGRSLRQPSMRSTLSTASSSSAYSMASAVSSVPRLPALSRHSTIKLDSPMATVFEREERNVPPIHSLKRPATLVTRSSSSGCFVHSYYYGGTGATYAKGAGSTEGDESKQQALVDRRKSRRVV